MEAENPKWTERDAIVADTARAIKVSNLEGLREKLDTLKPQRDNPEATYLQKRVNPFVHEDRIDSWELAKIVAGFIIVPIRVFFMVFCLLMCVVLLKISTVGWDPKIPIHTGWRRWLQLATNHVFFRSFLLACGVLRISTKGAPAPSRSPWQARMVVCAPHSTFLDGFIITYLLNVASPVAKKEAANGLMGPLLQAAQAILVDRKSKSARHGALQLIIDRVQSELPWRHLFLFPEGTCTNRRALINFKIGAFAPARPIQPVLLRWDKNVNFDPTWTSAGPNRTWMMFRLLCQVYTVVEVEFLPVYVPDAKEREDPAVYAAGVRAKMAKELGIPETEHSYEDSFLAALARKRKLTPNSALPFEFAQLQKLHNITYDEASRLLKRFTEVKRKKKTFVTSGGLLTAPQITELSSKQIEESKDRLDVNEFAELLGLPLNEPVVEFFSYLDVIGEGSIDFPAYLIGLTFLSKNASLEDAAKIVWATLDRNNTGVVPLKHVKKVLDLVFSRVNQKTIPLLRNVKNIKKAKISYEEFLELLRSYPEYIPIALHVSSLPVSDRAQHRMSLTTATIKLNEKEKALKSSLDLVKAQEANIMERHISFQRSFELQPSVETKLNEVA